MSISVSLMPYLLFSSIGVLTKLIYDKNETIKNNCDNINNYSIRDNMCEKDYLTNITSRDTLIKTLVEHGCTINEEKIDYIKCSIENLSLEFYKEKSSEDEPYKLKIKHKEYCIVDDFIEDLNFEYTRNAQEASYNIIKKRLEEKNMSIEEEEVFEDDSIVITVNLD